MVQDLTLFGPTPPTKTTRPSLSEQFSDVICSRDSLFVIGKYGTSPSQNFSDRLVLVVYVGSEISDKNPSCDVRGLITVSAGIAPNI